ncbi:isocitrate lyase/PEP mutase family protein [Amycolatopsis sp. NPDC004378]
MFDSDSRSCTQLPDIGLSSLSEHLDAVARVMNGTDLPVMVDGENGFGDVKTVTRAIRFLERLGVAAVVLEDLRMPTRAGHPPRLVDLADSTAVLRAALAARRGDLLIVGRTDAAYLAGIDEALHRATQYQALGVDAIMITGVTDEPDHARVRDAVDLPIVATVVEDGPALSPARLAEIGYDVVLYPATLMRQTATAVKRALRDVLSESTTSPEGTLSVSELNRVLRLSEWVGVDDRAGD